MQRILAIIFAVTISSPATAQIRDTINRRTPLFVPRDIVTLAAFSAATAVAWPLDKYLANKIQRPHSQENRFFKDAATGFRIIGEPGAIGISLGLYGFGRITNRERTADLGLHSLEAMGFGTVLGGSIKIVAGRARPFVNLDKPHDFSFFRGLKGDQYTSFPSGHTTTAFAFASTVASETQRWWPDSRWIIGPIVYTGATLVGASRMYNNKHWASDILAGAMLGTFSGTKVVRYQHSHPGNWLDEHLLRRNANATLIRTEIPLISVDF